MESARSPVSRRESVAAAGSAGQRSSGARAWLLRRVSPACAAWRLVPATDRRFGAHRNYAGHGQVRTQIDEFCASMGLLSAGRGGFPTPACVGFRGDVCKPPAAAGDGRWGAGGMPVLAQCQRSPTLGVLPASAANEPASAASAGDAGLAGNLSGRCVPVPVQPRRQRGRRLRHPRHTAAPDQRRNGCRLARGSERSRSGEADANCSSNSRAGSILGLAAIA